MKLLFVDCCISQRVTDSRTRALADAFLTAFRSKHPDTEAEKGLRRSVPASNAFVPAAAGLIAASRVIQDLTQP